MKIQYGSIPALTDFDPEAQGLQAIRGPNKSRSLWIATLTGFLLILPLTIICLLLSYFALPGKTVPNQPVDWGAVAAAIVAYVPLHEALHLIWHPRFGTSDRSFLILWPARLQFGVYYEGCMSRGRWLLMRLAPLMLLSILPAAFDAIFQHVAFTQFSKTFLEVVMLLNCVGSGADVAACFVVLAQVPRTAQLCFRGGRAYWKATDSGAAKVSPAPTGA